MDFRVPDKNRYQDPRPAHRAPAAYVPPPRPHAAEPVHEEPVAKKRRRKTPAARSWKKILAILLLAAIIGWLAYGYITTKNQLENQKSSAGAGQTETQQLVSKVGALVDLPPGETPTIATVNNASKLNSQAFFANAKNGDKVLIFSKSGKAVLYRPSTNKVIEYSKVNLSSSTP